jgi:hypothetical protein
MRAAIVPMPRRLGRLPIARPLAIAAKPQRAAKK